MNSKCCWLCKHWREYKGKGIDYKIGICAKITRSKEIMLEPENAMVKTDPDFYCKHFEQMKIKTQR